MLHSTYRHRYHDFNLVLINGLLTSVGGRSGWFGRCTNSLLSLTGEGGKMQWSEVFSVMPTPRSLCASVTTEQALIVAGGMSGVRRLDIVEVMDIPSQQWTTAIHLQRPCLPLSVETSSTWLEGTMKVVSYQSQS